ncbi:hypothetical protein T492DRAFT_943526 [Pavlovales sp. CCMP2436]|nr:hypothetical protein T492DRAFT_943526 [Pavlovales sp. CCMP2436]|mmetsp:Transcript_24351/g.57689  ORF Transcript_24351/g.57689 Transcript_24351/m.57689 type:complete len:106 (-) Transcript_24351:326-643(-)
MAAIWTRLAPRALRAGAPLRWQTTLCLRGVPQDATVEEVRVFLGGSIPEEGIVFRKFPKSGNFNGWATIVCRDAADEAAVKATHMQHMRHKYIEVIDDHHPESAP